MTPVEGPERGSRVRRGGASRPSSGGGVTEARTAAAMALADLRASGAEVVDGITVERVQRQQGAGTCRGFLYDLNEYLAIRGAKAPVHTVAEIIASPSFAQFPASVQAQLKQRGQGTPGQGNDSDACKADAAYRTAFGAAVTKVMDSAKLDAFVYPTWSNPPRLIGDMNTPHGDNSQVFSPTTGWPAINVPMGYTRGTLPVGITIFGRAWSEPTLIKFAYAYEQATHHRHPPASAPPLR